MENSELIEIQEKLNKMRDRKESLIENVQK